MSMDDETAIGGPDGRFPATRRSILVGARSAHAVERRQAYEALVEGYWKPIYKHLRLRWRRTNEDAKDLTQDFLAMAVEKSLLDDFDAETARLRTYLRMCLDRFIHNRDRDAARLKRGGGAVHLSLDFEGAEAELAARREDSNADEAFEREWLRALFSQAVEALEADCRARGREVDFRLFELYDLRDDEEADVTYADLAARLDLPVTTVTNRLAAVRRRFRAAALEALREMTGSDQEYRREARRLFGREAG